MEDTFASMTQGLESPPSNIFPVTPSDTENLPYVTRAINVATSGMVRITTVSGDTADLYIASGVAFPVRVARVWQAGTTAAGIIGLY